MYYAIKHLHVVCVVLSAAGFLLRGMWMLTGNPMLSHRLTRVLPHIIDSLLLLSAITLAVMIAQYPFAADWVTAKVGGLVAYVLLGTLALKRGPTKPVRAGAFAAALFVYVWIVSVAFTKNPAGFLA
ncbi:MULTISPECIES: SirB2 family protein [unclassified Thauera]|uniref:SirB2 family protein n=1 Tax=unclassified Thauera TaxID=2609274 RepID=UPI0002D070F1|nr:MULTISPECIES: SirB2 family protein [unclassified Thauera]ENO94291.1 invasion gene expression up-regulator SirB [Thauera sp. 28]WBL63186.1 SirB2 family protein [Thauera sp. WB-2]HAG76565.1 regulator SirB [Thauera sp.]HAY11535.1 regulator SirB [Thauera sp.]HNR61559.1 SirB2 family protein [Thauera sp.]